MRIRYLLALAVLLMNILLLILLLVLTDTALSAWEKLSQLPAAVQILLALLAAGLIFASWWLAWRWLRPQPKAAKPEPKPVSPEQLKQDLQAADEAGIDVDAALQELRQAHERKQSGEVFIALFGEVSSGKSSLINALVPSARAATDAVTGTTRSVRHYHWTSPAGDHLVISDLPGISDREETQLAATIMDEARRAHLVVFLCDSDLTASESESLARLQQSGKPLILALNKSDLYDAAELKQIVTKLARSSGISKRRITTISSGGKEQIIQRLEDGSEQVLVRDRPVNVEPLRQLLQSHLDRDGGLMESLRDSAILILAAEKLEDAKTRHRREQSELLVNRYSKRAVVGAMAAVTPGSDLIIQGALATKLIQELCKLHGVQAREMEIDQLLRLAGSKLKRYTAITLAIAGNAFKAFPGIGTITGGLLHAVAYGMIFDSLGKAVAETLASRGELRVYPTVAAFEEILSDNLQTRVGHFARLALAQDKKD